jgi:hypothetical protein
MNFNKIIQGTRKAAIRHHAQVEDHVNRVMKALEWWEKKTGTKEINLSVVVKYKKKSCMVVAYNLNFPHCYFKLQPMKGSDDIGYGCGMAISVEF